MKKDSIKFCEVPLRHTKMTIITVENSNCKGLQETKVERDSALKVSDSACATYRLSFGPQGACGSLRSWGATGAWEAWSTCNTRGTLQGRQEPPH